MMGEDGGADWSTIPAAAAGTNLMRGEGLAIRQRSLQTFFEMSIKESGYG